MLNKFLLLLIFSLTLVSCTQNDKEKIKVQSLDWLVGSWTRTNDNPNKQTFEDWEKISNNKYQGLGCTLENGDTTFKENMHLVKSDNNWVLEVRGVNENMTPFVFTNSSDSSFTCENEQNEFPKKIKYSIRNNLLEAVISADSIEVLFTFVKK